MAPQAVGIAQNRLGNGAPASRPARPGPLACRSSLGAMAACPHAPRRGRCSAGSAARARQPAGLEGMQGWRVGNFERVKAAAQHQRNFVDQHVADRPQFAAKLTPVAQYPRVRERSAVGELVEGERDQRPVREVERCACASAPASTAIRPAPHALTASRVAQASA